MGPDKEGAQMNRGKAPIRAAVYDRTLHLEACRLTGTIPPSPPHFHEYYVLGLVERGVSPYRCLESLRVAQARTDLALGIRPADAAQRAGFSDQSHFSHTFARLTGFPPGMYRAMFTEKETKEKKEKAVSWKPTAAQGI